MCFNPLEDTRVAGCVAGCWLGLLGNGILLTEPTIRLTSLCAGSLLCHRTPCNEGPGSSSEEARVVPLWGGQPGPPTEELSPWRGGGVPVFDREVEKVRAEGSPRRALQKNVEMRNLGQGDIFVVLNEGFQMSPLATRMPVLSRTCSVRNPAYLSTANTDLSSIFVIVVPNRI